MSIFLARFAATSLALSCLLLALAPAQEPDAEPENRLDPTAAPLAAGHSALAAGRVLDAHRHYLHALQYDPANAEILGGLLAAAQGDSDALTLWSHRWYAALADKTGKVQPAGDARRYLSAEDRWPAKLAVARATAVKELVDLANARDSRGKKDPEQLLVARWARGMGLDIANSSAALRKAYGEQLEPLHSFPASLHKRVLSALSRLAARGLSNGRTDLAIRAARILNGFAVQAAFDKLQGDRPSGMGKFKTSALAALGRARSKLASRAEEPWTVEQLEWFTREEGEAFTREHGSFGTPGVAVSPRNWYRIESDCGVETLLGVARTVEDHHERLVDFYGQDPFEERQGTIRVVPDANGLESEGAPYWWVGGFQGGDITVGRFSCGTIEGFGRLLTHELTHRFDGAIYPGQPAWLSEGKAVWTGAAFGHSSDASFVPMHCSFGTVESSFIKGYSSQRKLQKLIEGKLEDYRDNYTAGYALYLYLNTWKDGGRRLYHDQLEKFMLGCNRRKGPPLRFFEGFFCDGKEGRPQDFDTFAADFGFYISGFYWKSRKPFTSMYTSKTPPGGGDGYVYDEPTWVWSRRRAEPFFGGQQAALAGELLVEEGKLSEAVAALTWALAADGREPRIEALLAATLRKLKRDEGAWVVEQRLAYPQEVLGEEYPKLSSLPRTRALIGQLAEAAAEYAASGAVGTAAAMQADHARLAAWIGRAVEPFAAPLPAVASEQFLHPFDVPARLLGLAGWTEDGLTGYEEKRRKGCWYDDGRGGLHVGRDKPKKGSGKFERASHQRHAFVYSKEWVSAGVWSLKTRVQFTTAFANGCIVLGYGRRDLNLRLNFGAGDFMYAIGESDEEPEFEKMRWSIDGLFTRDGALPGGKRSGNVQFERPKPAFDLELIIDGATLHVYIDDKLRGTYHTVLGDPIEGHVGFATSMGAVRVQAPVIQRLDRTHFARSAGRKLRGLDLSAKVAPPFDQLVNRRVRGLPHATQGSILLWMPMPWMDDGDDFDAEALVDRAIRSAQKLSQLMQREGTPQPFYLAAPAALGTEHLATLSAGVRELDVVPEVITHLLDGSVPEGMEDTPDGNKRWLLFIDGSGVARVAGSFFSSQRKFEERIRHWLDVFRDVGRPTRELPTYSRETRDEEEPDDED